MRTNRMSTFMTCLTLTALAWVPLASAQSGGFGRGPRGEDVRGGRLERLDLDPAQRERVEAILMRHRESRRAGGGDLRTARRELNGLVQAEFLDEAAIRQTATRLGELEANAAIARARMNQELRQVLNADQIEMLMNVRRPRGGHGRGHGPHREHRGRFGDEAGLSSGQ